LIFNLNISNHEKYLKKSKEFKFHCPKINYSINITKYVKISYKKIKFINYCKISIENVKKGQYNEKIRRKF